jgi:uncharacterized membrane protein YeaQ/YmgE (transglycosylase-associated protein family)
MKALFRLTALAAVLASLAGPAQAQHPSTIHPGDTIRVTGRDISGIHTVLAASDSALDLRNRKGELRSVPTSDLRRVERLEGRSKFGGMVHDGILGLFGGAVVGAGLGHLADDPDAFLPGAFVGAVIGAAGGLVAGVKVGGRRGLPRWRPVKLASR